MKFIELYYGIRLLRYDFGRRIEVVDDVILKCCEKGAEKGAAYCSSCGTKQGPRKKTIWVLDKTRFPLGFLNNFSEIPEEWDKMGKDWKDPKGSISLREISEGGYNKEYFLGIQINSTYDVEYTHMKKLSSEDYGKRKAKKRIKELGFEQKPHTYLHVSESENDYDYD